MTAKDKLHERVDALSEEEAKRLLSEIEETRPGDEIDDRGNLSAFVQASSRSMFERLDEEEEKAGFSWGKYR